jgi:hypothetical protein
MGGKIENGVVLYRGLIEQERRIRLLNMLK